MFGIRKRPIQILPTDATVFPIQESNSSKFDIDIKPDNDGPKFGKKYKIQLTPEVKLKIRAWSWYSDIKDRHYDGDLEQKNGDWVSFDPKHPAKKILDRDLLPFVEMGCQTVLTMDTEYINSNPDIFTDDQGVTWKKVLR